MTNMKLYRSDLEKFTILTQELESIKREQDYLLEMATSCVLQLDQCGVKKQGSSDKVGNVAAKLADNEVKIKNKISKITDLLDSIEDNVDLLPPDERLIIRLRYIEGLKWENVAQKANYSVRSSQYIHNKAMNLLFC